MVGRRLRGLLLAVCVLLFCLDRRVSGDWIGPSDAGTYTDEWAIHVPDGEQVARRVAEELGYDFKGQVRTL